MLNSPGGLRSFIDTPRKKLFVLYIEDDGATEHVFQREGGTRSAVSNMGIQPPISGDARSRMAFPMIRSVRAFRRGAGDSASHSGACMNIRRLVLDVDKAISRPTILEVGVH